MSEVEQFEDQETETVDVADAAQSADQAKKETEAANQEPKASVAPQTPATRAPAAAPIGLNDAGIIETKDSSEEWRLAEMMFKSRALPKQFENVPQVIMAVQFLKAHGLQPMIAIRQTTIINGTLSIWGDLPKALVIRSGLLEEFEEKLYDREYKEISIENKNLTAIPFFAACRVKRKDRPSVTKTFTMEEAKLAGVLEKSGPWQTYQRRMLQMRTRSFALKDEFPDVLSGISINEYDHNMVSPDEMEQLGLSIKKVLSIADQINADSNEEKTDQEPKATGSG